ncbi:hypothetical protein STEG23_003401, partial [Scotinomys teguina]
KQGMADYDFQLDCMHSSLSAYGSQAVQQRQRADFISVNRKLVNCSHLLTFQNVNLVVDHSMMHSQMVGTYLASDFSVSWKARFVPWEIRSSGMLSGFSHLMMSEQGMQDNNVCDSEYRTEYACLTISDRPLLVLVSLRRMYCERQSHCGFRCV